MKIGHENKTLTNQISQVIVWEWSVRELSVVSSIQLNCSVKEFDIVKLLVSCYLSQLANNSKIQISNLVTTLHISSKQTQPMIPFWCDTKYVINKLILKVNVGKKVCIILYHNCTSKGPEPAYYLMIAYQHEIKHL